MRKDVFLKTLRVGGEVFHYFSLRELGDLAGFEVKRMPYSIRVLLENLLRNVDDYVVEWSDVEALGRWPRVDHGREIPFKPTRAILQDFTGVPAVVDLAAMRSALKRIGKPPSKINPLIPVDLVVDHSIQVDFYGIKESFILNLEREFERNRERYTLLKWAQQAFRNFRVVPPGKGIIHQVNLEYLTRVIDYRQHDGRVFAFPDTLLGTDSHTPMINSIGVVGWGVGGIEAEAVILGQPYYMPIPKVVGVYLTGELQEGTTATDLVLTVTQRLRKHGVVGKFVEYFGPGVKKLSIPDRATVANMAPEYGATIGFFPIDQETLSYLRMTGRDEKLVELYSREQMLFRDYDDGEEIEYSEVVEIDLSEVEPSIAGPSNPEDRIPLREAKRKVLEAMKLFFKQRGTEAEIEDDQIWFYEGGGAAATQRTVRKIGAPQVKVAIDGEETELTHGCVVISAITSCTNTSNPSVMIGAGLLAKKAVEKGLKVKPYVKTSLAPGSTVVTEYLSEAGLTQYLEKLGYTLVGYGCTTCIGNSGPLREEIEKAIKENDLYTAAVLSGNRNFEGRIHPLVRASFLMSPILVVAYGLAGRVDIDILREPIGYSPEGKPVYLKDIWPQLDEIRETINRSLKPEMFKKRYAEVFKGDEKWESLAIRGGEIFEWDENSTYIREPPFFQDLTPEPPPLQDIIGARALALLEDRVTTDHISPAGAIPPNSPAGKYLIEKGISPLEFNTYGARRGNHEVMIRGTFANIRLRNKLTPDKEGWWTIYHPTGEVTTIYEAAMRYIQNNIPLIVIAGKQYGAGSSRDWAAKGTKLLGVKAVIAESFERIHRSNLVGMGVLPLQFQEGEGWKTLGLDGKETYDITGIKEGLTPRKQLTVTATKTNGEKITFKVTARLDTRIETEYYQHGGILQYVLRKIAKQ